MRRWLCYGILILAIGWWRGCDTLVPPTVVSPSPSQTPSVAVPPVATPTLTAEVFLERGDNLARQGDYRGAIAQYDQALARNPQYAQAYNGRGNAYLQLGDPCPRPE